MTASFGSTGNVVQIIYALNFERDVLLALHESKISARV